MIITKEALQLYISKGAGEVALKRFLSFAMLHGKASATDLLSSPEDLSHHLRLLEPVARNIIASKESAMRLFDELCEQSIFILLYGETGYPERLMTTFGKSAPAVLFCRGNKSLLEDSTVGFCGSRKSSEKGLEVTAECAMLLSKRQITVVSGHASGVDMAAHCSAIKNNGRTILVIPEGIQKFKLKTALKNIITHDNHLVISQFSPGLPWSGRNAMQRNGLIIGLSEAMILVESGLNGGTFEAGNETLRLKKPLFVVSYQAPGHSAEANSYFIDKGGLPILRSSVDGLPNLYTLLKKIKENKDDRSHERIKTLFQ